MRSFSLCLCMLAALLSGCAPVPLKKPPELEAEKRAALGRVAVSTARSAPDELLKRPASKGEGAVSGAASGAAAGAASGVYMSVLTGPFAPLFVVPFAVAGGALGAGAGAVIGGLEGVSADELRSSERVIVEAIEAERSQEAMLRAFMEEAGRRGTLLGKLEGPGGSPGEAHYMEAAGFDTVVEVSLVDFSLYGEGAFNPPLSLLVNARAKVVRTSDGAAVYERVFRCESLARQFTRWAEDGALLLRQDADLCRKALSRNITRSLFGPEN